MKRISRQLQQRSIQILDVVGSGMEKPEVKAIRGVGYAILALVQFLRESEQTQCTCGPGCGPVVVASIDVMQEVLDG